MTQEMSRYTATQCPALWVIDENIPAEVLQNLPHESKKWIYILTNRFDLYHYFQGMGWQVVFNDFCFNALPENIEFKKVFYRISKEKAITHHIINQSFNRLPQGGELFLLGMKSEGIKTYQKKTAELFGHKGQSKKKGNLFVSTYSKNFEPNTHNPPTYLDDQHYSILRPLPNAPTPLEKTVSKPGLFGWQKIDQGSALLIQTITEQIMEQSTSLQGKKLLDLGCGYGYLSIMLRSFQPGSVIATDNNAAALIACQENFHHYDIPGSVKASHVGDTLQQKFDVIVCNPPFHSGFHVNDDLTSQFLQATKKRLTAKGEAFFVVNQFIPLEKKATPFFSNIHLLKEENGFKVFHLLNSSVS